MRKLCSLLFAILFSLLYISAAMAETRTFSIKELPGVTSPRWKQTYEAYGRTIDVDVDITIPETETAPVLKVCRAPVLEDPLRSELAEKYEKADKQDKKHYYYFESTDFITVRLQHKFPILWGTSKKKDNLDSVTTTCRDLINYDPDEACAENNPMTVREATEIIRTHLKEVLPDVELRLDTVVLYGKTFWRRNKKTVYDKGFYSLHLTQCFHGIPYMASIYDTYTDPNDQLWDWNNQENRNRRWNMFHGVVDGMVFSEDSWYFTSHLYEEKEPLCQDVPLVPFDAVKSQVENLITSGYVRWINSVTLGYVHFETDNDREFVLIPCWVVWCEYHKGGAQSEKKYGINDSELMFENSDYYRPLVINALTGGIFDPESTVPGRTKCPDLSAWQ